MNEVHRISKGISSDIDLTESHVFRDGAINPLGVTAVTPSALPWDENGMLKSHGNRLNYDSYYNGMLDDMETIIWNSNMDDDWDGGNIFTVQLRDNRHTFTFQNTDTVRYSSSTVSDDDWYYYYKNSGPWTVNTSENASNGVVPKILEDIPHDGDIDRLISYIESTSDRVIYFFREDTLYAKLDSDRYYVNQSFLKEYSFDFLDEEGDDIVENIYRGEISCMPAELAYVKLSKEEYNFQKYPTGSGKELYLKVKKLKFYQRVKEVTDKYKKMRLQRDNVYYCRPCHRLWYKFEKSPTKLKQYLHEESKCPYCRIKEYFSFGQYGKNSQTRYHLYENSFD